MKRFLLMTMAAFMLMGSMAVFTSCRPSTEMEDPATGILPDYSHDGGTAGN